MRLVRVLLTAAVSIAALLLIGLSPGCSRPEGLRIGPCELEYEELATAEAELAQSFSQEGVASRRWHLMEFGMGEAALLHHALPEASQAAEEQARAAANRAAATQTPFIVFEELRKELGQDSLAVVPLQPYPSALGARIAAKVASLESGEWAGPIRTMTGWSLVFLQHRFEGPRNRANVLVYEVNFPVGTPEDRSRAQQEWATLPLSGNPELLDALPMEFRRGRVRETS